MQVILMVNTFSIMKKYLDSGELYFTITYDQGKEVKYDGEALDTDEIIKE